MTHVACADALGWLHLRYPSPRLILTDPPHLDTFPSVAAYYSFCARWLRTARQFDCPLVLSCGSTVAQLRAYTDECWPDVLCVWEHETGASRHFYLAYNVDPALVVPRAPKPEPWYDQWIERLTKPGDLVLDPFCGRGEVPLAALRTGRRYAGCDLNPEAIAYCQEAGL